MTAPQPQALRVTFPGTGRPAASFAAAAGAVVTVGRPSSSGSAPDVPLQDASVSRRHAEFAWLDGRWQVRSLGQGGSSLDANALAPESWVPLGSGATLAIGPYRMRLVLGDAAATVAETLMLEDVVGGRAEAVPRRRLEREIDVARRIQAGTFPSGFPVSEGWEIAAESRPADSCGGDAFDVVPMLGDEVHDGDSAPDGYVLSIADATEHGVASALSSVQVRAMLRLGLRTGRPIVRIAEQVNAQLCRDLPDGRNVTAWFARLDAVTGDVHAVSAGQGPILVYRLAADAFEVHGGDQPPLGVVAIPYPDAESKRFTLDRGDLLVALTDGYYEAPAADGGDRFGDARVMEAIRGARDGSAHEVLAALKRSVEAFTGGAPLEDDRTALVVRRVP